MIEQAQEGVEIPGRVIRTRAVITPPDVLTQLREKQIPFTLKVAYPNHPKPFLSVRTDSWVDGWTHEDGSGRQQWLIRDELKTLTIAGGIDNPSAKALTFMPNADNHMFKIETVQTLPLYSLSFFYSPRLMEIPNTDFYQISERMYSVGIGVGTSYNLNYNLGLKDATSEIAVNRIPSSSLLEQWQIIPLEDYEILEISYDFVTGDTFTVAPVSITRLPLTNNTNLPAQRNFTITGEVTNRSKFSNTEKLSVNIANKASFKGGIPLFAEADMELTVTTGSEWSWSTEEETTKKETISQTISQELPPHTTVIASIVGTQYKADITYYAKIRGKITGTILYLPGRWEGTIINDTSVELSHPDGQVFRQVKL